MQLENCHFYYSIIIRFCVFDEFQTQEICDKVILENGRMLKFILDKYKNQKLCYKAPNNNFHVLKLAPD